jgi:hypothetical protein
MEKLHDKFYHSCYKYLNILFIFFKKKQNYLLYMNMENNMILGFNLIYRGGHH